MLTGCINGMKSEENRYFSLKTSQLTAYLHRLGCHSHGFAALRHCYCQPISMLLHEKQASKRIEKCATSRNTMIHSQLQNILIFPIFTASRDVVRKYAKDEEVFVKKKDK